jgi:hypothetical protein
VEPFYSQLQAVVEDTRQTAGESAEKLGERLADARRILALGRDFVRSAEHEVQNVEAALLGLTTLSGENGATIALRGRRLVNEAVDLLKASGKPQPIHYSDWFRLLQDAGRVIGAKDPMATFLTSITRDDRVERVGNRTGMYQLRA